MKKFYALFIILISMSAAAQDWQWMTGIEGAYGGYYDLVSADGEGNVYTYGNISENVTTPGYQINTTGTGDDMYFVKFNAAGEMQWYRHPVGNGNESLWNLDTDVEGNVFISGSFTNGISFGNQSFTGTGSFIAKYDTDGNLIWVKNFSLCWHKRLRVDASGNIYLIGTFYNPLTYDAVTLTPAEGNQAAFIIKVNSAGSILWGRLAEHPSNGFNDVNDVNIDSGGNVYMSGTYGVGSLTLGTITLAGAASGNTYFVKYDSNGMPQWAKRFGDSACTNSIMSVISDNNGSLFISGFYCGTLNLDGISLTSPTGSRLFVAKYTDAGTINWAKTSTGSGLSSSIKSADLDANGDLIVSGNCSGPLSLGNNVNLTTAYQAKFIAKYSADGTARWITGSSETGVNNEISVECWGENIIYSAGTIINTPTLTFGDVSYTKAGNNLYNNHVGKLLDNSLGIPEFETGIFRIYPNPVAGVLNIDSTEDIRLITITDINGRIVATKENSSSISTEELAKGVYLLTAGTDTKKVSKKIVKQ